MLPIETAYKVIYDRNGKPLENGYVYFGQPNLNPITAPIAVYWDAAGTQPAVQPLRTVNGFIMRAGTPANVFVNGSYSQLVQDSKKRAVFYARTSDDFSIATLVQNFFTTIASGTGSSLMGFIQNLAGAVLRTVLDKLRDNVNVCDFMTPTQIANVRAGIVTDVTAEFQAALNSATTFSNTIELPPGNLRISSPLTTAIRGTRIIGASKYGTYLTAPDLATFDMLRIAHQQCEVANILFRPGGANQTPMRIYAGRAHIHDNYMLAAVNNSGIGITITDIDPVTLAFVPGAYSHTIENNIIGDSGFAFSNGIRELSTAGIQACKFRENAILSNRCIYMTRGGANVYRDNLLQSSTGAPSGVGITLGASISGEKISGNYFERFQAQIETLNVDPTYQLFHAVGNHNDACTAAVSDAGVKNYVLEDPQGKVLNNNGWSHSFASALWRVTSVSGNTTFAADPAGYCFLGATSGTSHALDRAGSTENTVIFNFKAAGGSIGYMQDARGTGINGANTFLAMNKNSVTNRSINAAGTLNASGADYAEYMRKEIGCGAVEKGQIVGINNKGEITDNWARAVTFATKSTDPSYVGGDVWHTDPRPDIPVPPSMDPPPAPADMSPRVPGEESSEKDHVAYRRALASYGKDRDAAYAQYVLDLSAFEEAQAQYKWDLERYEIDLAQWDADHEAARATVDRIAFSGQVPVNVWKAKPGQYIVPVQDGDGIAGKAVTSPTLEEYMGAIGRVIAIEADGRARIIVKVS